MITLLEFLLKKHIDMVEEEALKFSCKGTNALSLGNKNNNPNLYYKLSNMKNYKEWDYEPIEFGNGIDLFIKGDNPQGFSKYYPFFSYFRAVNITPIKCTGNVMFLLGENVIDIPCDGCFCSLFNYMPITTAPEIPALELKKYCYSEMFNQCTFLTKAPDLPAEHLPKDCYRYMFNQCYKLTELPNIGAKDIDTKILENMFMHCNKIKL